VVIVETKTFTAQIDKLLPLEEYRALLLALFERPMDDRAAGLRRLLWTSPERGKRGGVRILYFWSEEAGKILLVLAYGKNERDDLTSTQREVLLRLLEAEYDEAKPLQGPFREFEGRRGDSAWRDFSLSGFPY
jgi:mRNA-degrading endonuclease RelE of RelBE toxin-antitoxin system